MGKRRELKALGGHGKVYWFFHGTIPDVLTFIRRIPGYRRLDKAWDYDPETYTFIINNYTQVLCDRTKSMSKPTYYASDVLSQMDEWYQEREEGKWVEYNPDNCEQSRIIRCTECGLSFIVGYNVPLKDWCSRRNYCQRCGAKMVNAE